jgi:sRNA-binding carbon storage regulator CsrA
MDRDTFDQTHRLLILSRTLGQSLVIAGDLLLTLRRFEDGVATVSVANLRDENNAASIRLRQGEFAEVMPEVRITLLEPVDDRPRARFGLDVPLEIPIHRKEIFDAHER